MKRRRKGEKGLNIQKQVRDAQKVRPGEKLARLKRQYEEVRAMKERSEQKEINRIWKGRTRGGRSSNASAIAIALAEDISGGSTCISVGLEGDAAIADAFRGVGGSFLALPSSWRISKLADPTAEGPDCGGGVTGPSKGVVERSGGVKGS
jgi:hypothetical protein